MYRYLDDSINSSGFFAGTLIGLFSQIKTGGDEVRERAIKFLNLKIKTNSSDLLNPEAEAVLLEQISAIVEVSNN